MWKPSDICSDQRYRLLLIQSATGSRSFVLQDEREMPTVEGLFSFTERVSNELLVRRNLRAISKEVSLVNGEAFYVDAHGVWLTAAEMAAILQDKEDDEIPWLNSLPPKLAPK
ncbi:hypothetical protein AVXHC19_28070 [Acidovorax sacchari]